MLTLGVLAREAKPAAAEGDAVWCAVGGIATGGGIITTILEPPSGVAWWAVWSFNVLGVADVLNTCYFATNAGKGPARCGDITGRDFWSKNLYLTYCSPRPWWPIQEFF